MRLPPHLGPVRHPLTTSVAALLALLLATGAAQAPGFAEITDPVSASALEGLVTITGSASHPAFSSYDLAFAYAQAEAQTWFPIAENVSTPVINGRLAIWDTRAISDGLYTLRLIVHLDDSSQLEAIVDGLEVHNYTATQTPSPLMPAAGVVPTPTPLPTSTPPAASEAPSGADSGAVVLRTLRFGLAIGVAAVLGLGVLVLARRALRWGRAAVPRRSSQRPSRARRRKNRG